MMAEIALLVILPVIVTPMVVKILVDAVVINKQISRVSAARMTCCQRNNGLDKLTKQKMHEIYRAKESPLLKGQSC